ncbi:N-acetylmuramoyl-L-alanine amidase [Agrobacterium sp. SHOUNA12C]|uniref:N-acetylmuramoyl-L-alanine amidase n=2 Tax=Rhizobium rhizogenes TaxID=359 RepID=B9JH63_RHIR8|nr:N-acetylmuramoyl-L-alanine amidase [Rhizobium rhizogenes]ACM27060.1 N-acetylmuramoyl-L-alanine amidase protein [Rhizobium rhizogenes K84]KAA6490077.1 N-acetylmuramoyl-L-alanine amidase [Agrobacterium sp. ICMP 7243]MCJ9719798.1 N-acetylmuramoyl-L-alanine amidase [Agrobacterium sp. BETTINA12B]MCJ9755267.1 N-acetylmuramoyl-L-alanine amidase [Agrobacterium sp. SHOUNA12C]OCJ05673.1 N-acetylmuramoyl-L-alanine amidase [Agrobacterium sp. 13-626]OCJ14839.1 N-acetylmuramoyl-L-alanine amidase [Agroba
MSSFPADFAGASVQPSPNHGEREGGRKPDMILLHYTGMGTAEGALDWLCRAESQVSSHYFVFEDGRVVQLVPEERRAWHAGKSLWRDEADINSLSIGIEIANAGHPGGLPDFPDAQVEAVIELCRDCGQRWAIAPERVLGHSDVAPVRKVDPGEKFPWARLAAAGVGHWVEPAPITGGRFFQKGDVGQPIEALQSMLSLYGYGTEITGEFSTKLEGDVQAFQRHFRPARVDGIADFSTIDTLHRLLSSLPRFS